MKQIYWSEDEMMFFTKEVKIVEFWWNDYVSIETVETEGKTGMPVFPGMPVEEVCYFETRLRSTRSGVSSRWSIHNIDQVEVEGLNNSKFNPMFRGFVKNFSWAPPGKGFELGIFRSPGIWQEGRKVANWYAVPVGYEEINEDKVMGVSKPHYQHLRQWLRDRVKTLSEETLKQEDLTVWACPDGEDFGEGKISFEDHVMVADHYMAQTTELVRWNEFRLVGNGRNNSLIVSRNGHELRLKKGYWVVHHPMT